MNDRSARSADVGASSRRSWTPRLRHPAPPGPRVDRRARRDRRRRSSRSPSPSSSPGSTGLALARARRRRPCHRRRAAVRQGVRHRHVRHERQAGAADRHRRRCSTSTPAVVGIIALRRRFVVGVVGVAPVRRDRRLGLAQPSRRRALARRPPERDRRRGRHRRAVGCCVSPRSRREPEPVVAPATGPTGGRSCATPASLLGGLAASAAASARPALAGQPLHRRRRRAPTSRCRRPPEPLAATAVGHAGRRSRHDPVRHAERRASTGSTPPSPRRRCRPTPTRCASRAWSTTSSSSPSTTCCGRQLIERDITLTCVSNEVGGRLVGNARWLGTPPRRRCCAEAGVQPGADQVVGRSVDGYECGFPVDGGDGRARRDGRHRHERRAAARSSTASRPASIVPGLYGYVSATKWLTEIELTTFDEFDHYWLRRGWAQRGTDQADEPHRHAARGWPRCRPASCRSPAWRGRRPSASPASRSRSTTDRWQPDRARRGHDERHVAPVGVPLGRPRPAATRSRSGRSTTPAQSRPRTAPNQSLTERPDTTRSW